VDLRGRDGAELEKRCTDWYERMAKEAGA
jgi:hypothetical protein